MLTPPASFSCQRHGSDDGNQQQDRCDFERQQVLSIQGLTDQLSIARHAKDGLSAALLPGPGSSESLPTPQHKDEFSNEEKSCRDQAMSPLPVELAFMNRSFDRDQHDDEDEEHENAADIDDDLNAREKLGVKRQKDSRHGQQRRGQATALCTTFFSVMTKSADRTAMAAKI